MTIEEALERIEKCIAENYYSQIWAQLLEEEIDTIRKEVDEEIKWRANAS